jgi:hypothetical protein
MILIDGIKVEKIVYLLLQIKQNEILNYMLNGKN